LVGSEHPLPVFFLKKERRGREGGKEERRKGGREGRKEGRKEGRGFLFEFV
jgi:hypothetical protein